MLPPPYDRKRAATELAEAHPGLGETIAAVGPCTLTIREDDTLPALVRSITYQQLSGKAAATIHGRLLGLLGRTPTAEAIAATSDEALRACGLSRAKTAALRDLAVRALRGDVPPREDLLELHDDEVVRLLSEVRGVGEWTAQMFLMSVLGRPDVWPVGDLGVREGWRIVSRSPTRPTPAELADAGAVLRPWRSVAAWYLWRAVDLERDPDRLGTG